MFSHSRIPPQPRRKRSVRASIPVIGALALGIGLVGGNVHADAPNINDPIGVIPFVVPDGTGDSMSVTGTSVSGDGVFVVFSSFASDLVPVDNNGLEDVFLFNRLTGDLNLISRAADGSGGNAPSTAPVISADGATVAFTTTATNLFDDANGSVQDVVIYNRFTKTLTVANRNDPGEQSEYAAANPALSADGRFVAFDSASALVAEAVDGVSGIYVRNLENSTTQLLSRTPTGAFPNAASTNPAISADASLVAYVSAASDIVASAADVDNIFVINRSSLVTQLITKTANADSSAPAFSGSGEVVGFQSDATNLSNLDFNNASDVFTWTAATDTVELISRQASGESASGGSFDASLNDDGNLVLFSSLAHDLVSGDTNGVGDVFLRNRSLATTIRTNMTAAGVQADSEAFNPALSADGNTVVFWSNATNLSDVDAEKSSDVFLLNLGFAVPQPSVVAAVLPSSRSAQVNQTVTIFATMVASELGNGCSIDLASSIDASVDFQRTNPLTNAPISAVNVPVYMRPNVPMSFVLSITAFAPLEPQEVEFKFVCNTGQPAPVLITTNTLLFSASEVPVPDIVALSATINNDGIVNIPDAQSFGIFSAANVNLGAPSNITASLITLGETLDEALICPTVFETGACIEAPAQSTVTFIGSNGTASYGVFVRSSQNVPFLPAENRVVLIFTDDEGVVRGRTSVAVTTQ